MDSEHAAHDQRISDGEEPGNNQQTHVYGILKNAIIPSDKL